MTRLLELPVCAKRCGAGHARSSHACERPSADERNFIILNTVSYVFSILQTKVFTQEHYLENFIQSIFDVLPPAELKGTNDI